MIQRIHNKNSVTQRNDLKQQLVPFVDACPFLLDPFQISFQLHAPHGITTLKISGTIFPWLATYFGAIDYDTGQNQQQESERYYSISMYESHQIPKSHKSVLQGEKRSSKTIAEKLTACPPQVGEYFKLTLQVPCACKSQELEKLKNT